MKKETYQISEAEKLTGEKAHVLRYWEEELGLSIGRNAMGHRIYTGQDIQIFLSIKELKKKGLHLKAIRDLLPKLMQAAGQAAAEEEVSEVAVPAVLVEEVQAVAEKEKPEEETVIDQENNEIIEVFPAEPEQQSIRSDHEQTMSEKEERQAVILEIVSGGNRKSRRKNMAFREGSGCEDDQEKSGRKTGEKDERKEQFYQILERLMRQMLLKQRQEERYKRVDEAIRRHQQSRREAAATAEQPSRKKRKNRQNLL